MGEAKRRKALKAISAEAFGGSSTGFYKIEKYNADDVTLMVLRSILAPHLLRPLDRAIAESLKEWTKPGMKLPFCMSCEAEVPVWPDAPAAVVMVPGREENPKAGAICMVMCKTCDATHNTPAAFEAAAVKAIRTHLIPDLRVARPLPAGHA